MTEARLGQIPTTPVRRFRDMLSSAIVVFSVSSVSHFQRREDAAVAALIHGSAATPVSGHDRSSNDNAQRRLHPPDARPTEL
jgi:hypothetical protein